MAFTGLIYKRLPILWVVRYLLGAFIYFFHIFLFIVVGDKVGGVVIFFQKAIHGTLFFLMIPSFHSVLGFLLTFLFFMLLSYVHCNSNK